MQQISINPINGSVCFNDIDDLLSTFGSEVDIYNLKEDLLQVEYPDNTIIDVGWYPEFDLTGQFRLLVVKSGDWDSPQISIETRDINKLILLFNCLDEIV